MWKKKSNHYRGLLAEKLSIWFLRIKLYSIIDTRFRNRFGEIDIIARKGNLIVFVEVKLRSNKAYFFEALTTKQKKRIIAAAQLFSINYNTLKDSDIRFDLIFLAPWSMPIHIKNAWS